jgi:hypothetical protein
VLPMALPAVWLIGATYSCCITLILKRLISYPAG